MGQLVLRALVTSGTTLDCGCGTDPFQTGRNVCAVRCFDFELGRVDKVSNPEADGCEIDEAEIAFGGFVISGRQAA